MLFQMALRKIAIAPENLEIFHFSEFQEEEFDFLSGDLLAFKFIVLFISLNCYIYVELHTIYRIKIQQIVLELQAFVCKSPFSRMTSGCATDQKK